jgi:basic membrane protein A
MDSILILPQGKSAWAVSKLFWALFLASFLSVQAWAGQFRVGLVLDKGGKDDKSFNAAAYQGAIQAKEELKSYLKYVEATDDNVLEFLLRSFAQKNFDLIVAVGVSQLEAVKKIAAQFPQKQFAIVDGNISAPNVRSLLFEEHEGSFIVGAIAAQVSKSKVIGFIGGMDIPLIRRFQKGYEAGAKWINPQMTVLSNFVGITEEAWNNPARAKELAVSQYMMKADVVFGATGASGAGIFDAAEDMKKFAIGVDSNQNWVKPGYVLTSMVKKVDQAVYNVCKDAAAGKFTAGIQHFGIANNGVDYAFDSYNEAILPESVRRRANEIKAAIKMGKIHVPDFYTEMKK